MVPRDTRSVPGETYTPTYCHLPHVKLCCSRIARTLTLARTPQNEKHREKERTQSGSGRNDSVWSICNCICSFFLIHFFRDPLVVFVFGRLIAMQMLYSFLFFFFWFFQRFKCSTYFVSISNGHRHSGRLLSPQSENCFFFLNLISGACRSSHTPNRYE